METLIHEFGIDKTLFIAQVINFLIVFWILKKVLYKPILDLLKNREKTIAVGLKQAEEARVMLEKAEDREKEIIRKAQSEARKLLDDARAQREEFARKNEETTRKQVEQMLKEAKEQIAFETREAEKRLTRNISGLAVEFLQKSLSQLFTEKDQETLVKTVVKKMKERVD